MYYLVSFEQLGSVVSSPVCNVFVNIVSISASSPSISLGTFFSMFTMVHEMETCRTIMIFI